MSNELKLYKKVYCIKNYKSTSIKGNWYHIRKIDITDHICYYSIYDDHIQYLGVPNVTGKEIKECFITEIKYKLNLLLNV